MTDMFPATANTPVMTAPAILEWLSGEIDDVTADMERTKNPIQRGICAAIRGHLQGMSDRFAATTMRAMDGDTSAGRRQHPTPEGK